jgi:hypothetical protein
MSYVLIRCFLKKWYGDFLFTAHLCTKFALPLKIEYNRAMTWQEWLVQAAEFLENHWGIASNFSDKAALLLAYMYVYNLNPVITSGLRTAAKQRELQERYRRGDPSVVYPPATNSKHLTGEAIDISTNDPAKGHWIAQQLGIKTVSGDKVHYMVGSVYA